jgi:hypothetical protein
MRTDRAKSPTKFYTIPQIAECVDASRTVRRWIEKGLLVAYRINGGFGFPRPISSQAFWATPPGPLNRVPICRALAIDRGLRIAHRINGLVRISEANFSFFGAEARTECRPTPNLDDPTLSPSFEENKSSSTKRIKP